MRRLLLLVLTAGLAFPTTAKAETVYLVLRFFRYGAGHSLGVVPMESMDQCEEAGLVMKSSKRFNGDERTYFECIIGK